MACQRLAGPCGIAFRRPIEKPVSHSFEKDYPARRAVPSQDTPAGPPAAWHPPCTLSRGEALAVRGPQLHEGEYDESCDPLFAAVRRDVRPVRLLGHAPRPERDER